MSRIRVSTTFFYLLTTFFNMNVNWIQLFITLVWDSTAAIVNKPIGWAPKPEHGSGDGIVYRTTESNQKP